MTPDELKAFRARWNLSQRELASRIGYNYAMISLWESGKRTPIPKRVALILRGLECVLHDERTPEPKPEGA